MEQTTPSLLDRLTVHRTLAEVPRPQLEWLVAHGTEEILEVGEVMTAGGGVVRGLFVVLDGHLTIKVDRGGGPRMVMEWRGGDVTGVLPYSRIKSPPGSVVAQVRTTILHVPRDLMPQLIHDCPDLTAVLVHVMLDRARVFKSSELLDEKMLSLGRLAAGLAHELNNPASAVARTAKTLATQFTALEAVTRRFCTLNLSNEQCSAIDALRNRPPVAAATLSALERADRQDALADWLDAHGVSGVEVEALVTADVGAADLESLDRLVGREKLGTVLAHIAAGQTVRELVAEIDTAATRIHSLVAAVKGFTYVNQQDTLQPIAIGQGLADTMTVLRSKARARSVTIELEVPADLPTVEGYGGELNQVWANLVDNAIDAAPGGHVLIRAVLEDHHVVVRVIDDGPGIPPEIAARIFDPFFTTKDIGQGTGLGLDIARRIVQRHHGVIEGSSHAGRTEFRVTLPAVTR